jgi:hypothetical protein
MKISSLTHMTEPLARALNTAERERGMTIGDVIRLIKALQTARDLTEPGEPNDEYIRGQAELICDLSGLGTDYKEDVIKVISHQMPIGDLDLLPYDH